MTSKVINYGALTKTIDDAEIRTKQRGIDENSRILEAVVERLVDEYCRDLDSLMAEIRAKLSNANNPPTDMELEYYIMNLPVLLYYTSSMQENIGIREDMAKAARMEIYNQTFENAQKTVADKTAAAELATQVEYLTQISYQRAYKKIKFRIDAANELLQSLKKVMTRRVVEMELTRLGGR